MANPTKTEILDQLLASIYSYTNGELDPNRDLLTKALSKALSDMLDNNYKSLEDQIAQTFSQSATDETFLKMIAYDRTNDTVRQFGASQASGTLVTTSDSAETIPLGTEFLTNDGEIYTSSVTRTTSSQSALVTTMERISDVVYVELANHKFGNTQEVTFSGANETGFDGAFEIEVIDIDNFKYTSAGTDVTATGTILATFFGARVDVTSSSSSEAANKTFVDTIDIAGNVDLNDVYITFSGITGGSDDEDMITGFKPRLVSNLSKPQNPGNLNQHNSWVIQESIANYSYFFTSSDALNYYLTGVVSILNSDSTFTDLTVDQIATLKADFIAANQVFLGFEEVNLTITNPSFIDINLDIADLDIATIDMKDSITEVIRTYMALLPINALLSDAKSELSTSKIESIVLKAVDSNGQSPTFTSITVNNVGNLDSDIKKPILGSISYS